METENRKRCKHGGGVGAVVAADGILHLRHCPAEPFPSGEHGLEALIGERAQK